MQNEIVSELLANLNRQNDSYSNGVAELGRRHEPVRRAKPGKTTKSQPLQVLDQWVEVETTPEGNTVTTLYPPNEILRESAAELQIEKDLVYRRFHFVRGVPAEYAWTTNDESIRASGGAGIQRMTVATWLKQIEREDAQSSGHLLPCGGNLPRPEERGGCECQVCEENRQILGEPSD